MIKYYNRKSKKYEIEKVAGEKYLNWIYSSPIGMNLLELVIKKKLFSSLYGKYCDTKISKKKIDNFIKDFNIDMKICSSSLNEFNNFNDFFTRKLKKDSRPMSKDKDILISPGDGKLLAYENINLNKVSNIKGINYSFYELVKDKKLADKYSNGTCLILRLCPTDYHRFHFIDDGICTNTTKIKGDYYSVNPLALIKVPQLFCKNKREYSTFHSENFGNILFMEVGATCVGSIIQTYIPDKKVLKGEEKGYFKFGGSTVILFFEKGKIKIDPDILKQTESGYETQIFLGESIGYKVK